LTICQVFEQLFLTNNQIVFRTNQKTLIINLITLLARTPTAKRGTAYKPQLKVQFTPDSQSAGNQAYYFLGWWAGGL